MLGWGIMVKRKSGNEIFHCLLFRIILILKPHEYITYSKVKIESWMFLKIKSKSCELNENMHVVCVHVYCVHVGVGRDLCIVPENLHDI